MAHNESQLKMAFVMPNYHLLWSPYIAQFPNPVRVPAFIAAIRADGALLSKTVVPFPIQAPAATTPTLNPFAVSQHGVTEPKLPIRSATVSPGQWMHLSFENGGTQPPVQ